MNELLNKYGYVPDKVKIDHALGMIASNLENVVSDTVLKECFSMMDLTSLKTDDTRESVARLAGKVNDFRAAYPDWPLPASICVLKECELAVQNGADEVDIVLALNSFLAGDEAAAADEIRNIRNCIDAAAASQGRTVHLKVILETGLILSLEKIAEASFLAMEAGADFIKTSTGKVSVNATPAAAYVMCECISRYYAATGRKVGFKPAGGISSAMDAVSYYSIVSAVLGRDWLTKDLFRLGVSRLANNILSAVAHETVSYF